PLPPAPVFTKRLLPLAKRPGPPPGVAIPSFLPDRIVRAARRVFGITHLHPEQARAIEAVLTGHDAMAVLPTGYGKSLIYQVPAVLLDRPVLVISPLIALMRDQEDKLRARGVPVVRLDSTLRAQERRDGLARVARGGSLVVLTTPETLHAKDAKPAIEAARPALLAVDEAHCISEWGHDFRPAYLQLAETRKTLGVQHVLALTATATPHVREDIAQRLALQDPVVVLAPPHRANLRLGVHTVSGPSVKLEIAGRLLQRLPRPGILYCATTRAVDDIFAALSQTKIPCAKYHGGLSDEERSSAQARFMAKDGRIVMIATSAFGMGIDKPDIRYIVHFQVPGSLEQYVQEAGRAGRDGKQSDCVLLFDRADLQIQEFLEAQGRPTGAQLKRVATAISAWTEDDDEGASPNDLALAAGVPAGAARAACVELGELGLVSFDGKRKAKALVDAKALKKSTDELALRFDILAMQDKKRLDAITSYAEVDECRSAFIRRWFGEKTPPRCGKCDVCRIGERVRLIEEAEARGEAPPPPDIYDVTANKLRQAREAPRRGRRGRPQKKPQGQPGKRRGRPKRKAARR
ncbi:MAG: ATP-dependent DNA helicase RecQ, partial [Planctomycetes bacterium]|nr:ATP-dependent DNA helicase RecQ [Planctomycetota bacterium]